MHTQNNFSSEDHSKYLLQSDLSISNSKDISQSQKHSSSFRALKYNSNMNTKPNTIPFDIPLNKQTRFSKGSIEYSVPRERNLIKVEQFHQRMENGFNRKKDTRNKYNNLNMQNRNFYQFSHSSEPSIQHRYNQDYKFKESIKGGIVPGNEYHINTFKNSSQRNNDNKASLQRYMK